jgi:hypothetical protein
LYFLILTLSLLFVLVLCASLLVVCVCVCVCIYLCSFCCCLCCCREHPRDAYVAGEASGVATRQSHELVHVGRQQLGRRVLGPAAAERLAQARAHPPGGRGGVRQLHQERLIHPRALQRRLGSHLAAHVAGTDHPRPILPHARGLCLPRGEGVAQLRTPGTQHTRHTQGVMRG